MIGITQEYYKNLSVIFHMFFDNLVLTQEEKVNMLTPRFLQEINANPANVLARQNRFIQCLEGGIYDSWVKKCEIIGNGPYYLFINELVLVCFFLCGSSTMKTLDCKVNWTQHSKEMQRKPFVRWFVAWAFAPAIIRILLVEVKFYVFGNKGGYKNGIQMFGSKLI